VETTIRQATRKDMELIGEFLKRAYGTGQTGTSQYKFPGRWHWLYIDNPLISEADDKIPIWLAIRDNTIVGQMCGLPAEIKIGDQVYRGGWGFDFIVSQECRGQGIGHKLTQEFYQHYQAGIGLSMANSTRRIWKGFNHVPLKPMHIYLYPIRIDRTIVGHVLSNRFRLFQKLLAKAINAAMFIRRTFSPSLRRSLEKSIVEILVFGDEIDTLFKRTFGDYEAIAKRDSKYLTWRFSSNKQFEYRTFVLKDEDVVKGYIVVRKPHQREVDIGHIVDFYAAKDDIGTIDDLILYAIRFFGKSVTAIKCFSSVPKIEELLRRYGFLKIEKLNPLVLVPDASIKSRIASVSEDWFLTLADQDLDQVGFNLDASKPV
jgi:GNAT superfamily N-acetyltransferase